MAMEASMKLFFDKYFVLQAYPRHSPHMISCNRWREAELGEPTETLRHPALRNSHREIETTRNHARVPQF